MLSHWSNCSLALSHHYNLSSTDCLPFIEGYGILRVMELYSFAVHILFSLLIGRPLVVVGSAKHEKDVKAILSALLLFVPGHCRYGPTLSK